MLRRNSLFFRQPAASGFLSSTSVLLAKKKTNTTIASSSNKKSKQQQHAPSKKHRVSPKIEQDKGDDDLMGGGSSSISSLRVGVLHPHNEGTWDVDSKKCSPEIYASPQLHAKYKFDEFTIRKNTAFRQLRQIASEGKCDVFWNMCDGAKDEARTGEDTVRVLEALNVAFTGADSHVFEPSKIEMKMLLAAAGIRTPNFAVIDRTDLDEIPEACAHLRFPVIVKHISGYGSIGITKDSKCANMAQLSKKLRSFIPEFDVALVEEFIVGAEGTVLVCGDRKSPTGVHVFPPVMIPVPGGANDFLHFDKKWKNKKMEWECFDNFVTPTKNPVMNEKLVRLATNAFTHIMQRVGYGRCDFRIDDATQEPYFLEINPNCGIFLPDKKTGKPKHGEGDYADLMIAEDKEWGHDRFIRNQLEIALRNQKSRNPWWCHSYSAAAASFITKATRFVPKLTRIFGDEVRPVPVVARTLFDATLFKKNVETSGNVDDDAANVGDDEADEVGASGGGGDGGKSSSSSASSSSASRGATNGGGDSSSRSVMMSSRGRRARHSGVNRIKVGCSIFRGDGVHSSVMVQHSCAPNCALVHSNTIELATVKSVHKGDPLTIDYATLRDPAMPDFRCNCGEPNCRGIVKSQTFRVREAMNPLAPDHHKKKKKMMMLKKKKKTLLLKKKQQILRKQQDDDDDGDDAAVKSVAVSARIIKRLQQKKTDAAAARAARADAPGAAAAAGAADAEKKQ